MRAISEAERDKYWKRAQKALVRLGAEQERYQRDGDPVSVYLRSLIALVASGRAHLAHPDGGAPADAGQWGWTADGSPQLDDPRALWRPQGQRIGWIDGDDVYLQPDAAYTAARQYADAGGTPLAKTKTVLHKSLRERGLLKGTAADRLTVHGTSAGSATSTSSIWPQTRSAPLGTRHDFAVPGVVGRAHLPETGYTG